MRRLLPLSSLAPLGLAVTLAAAAAVALAQPAATPAKGAPPILEPLPEIAGDAELEPQVTIIRQKDRDGRGSARQRPAGLDQGHARPRPALFPGPRRRRIRIHPPRQPRLGTQGPAVGAVHVLTPDPASAQSDTAAPRGARRDADVRLHTRHRRGTQRLAHPLQRGCAGRPAADRGGHREHQLLRDHREGPLRADALRAAAGGGAAVLPQPDGAPRARRRRVPRAGARPHRRAVQPAERQAGEPGDPARRQRRWSRRRPPTARPSARRSRGCTSRRPPTARA